MAEQVDCRLYPAVLVDGVGNFNAEFAKDLKLAAECRPIAALSIGVQSTGKSTLLNQCFGTGFKEMDAKQGMHQTTKGIWIAKYQSPNRGHDILLIDTEGSDGSEREDDVKFEKQIALFALAVSNTVLINMKCECVNLNYGASRPLLRTVLEVMVRKFSTPRKVKLVFVLRDRNETPLDKLEEQLMKGLDKIWSEITKPQAQANAALEAYFTIDVVPLPHFRLENEQFVKEAASLKERIIAICTPAESSEERIAASGFSAYAQKIWNEIKEDKGLDLPKYWNMVAEAQCNRIKEETYQSFCENETWLQIKEEVESETVIVQGFGENVSSLINTFLLQYDEEARYYNETIRDASRKQLTEKLLQVVEPTYLSLAAKMGLEILHKFEEAALDMLTQTGDIAALETKKFIDEFQNMLEGAAIRQANWNHSIEKLNHLQSEIDYYVKGVHVTNQLLEEKKIDKDGFWSQFGSFGRDLLSVAIGAALQALLPGAGKIASKVPKIVQLCLLRIQRKPG